MTEPLVSVVVNTYNHEHFIEQAIVSVLEQDFPPGDMEILVVDDGSTDRTAEIVRRFEPRVRLLRKANGGQASAINFGVAQAKGTLIAFLDGDDTWLANKLPRVVKAFEKDPCLVMVYHRYCFWDVRENHTWEADFVEVSGDILSDRRKLLTFWGAPTSSLAFRRTVLERVMPVPEECSFMQDAYLIATTVCLGPVLGIAECLTKNKVHGQNLWFAERGVPNIEVLQRRLETRQAAINSVQSWVRSNGSRSSRSKIRILLKSWRLTQDKDEFQLKAPGRFRYFMHLCRYPLAYGPTMTRRHFAYAWIQALAVLALGCEGLHYVESARTRFKGFAHRVRRWRGPADPKSRTI